MKFTRAYFSLGYSINNNCTSLWKSKFGSTLKTIRLLGQNSAGGKKMLYCIHQTPLSSWSVVHTKYGFAHYLLLTSQYISAGWCASLRLQVTSIIQNTVLLLFRTQAILKKKKKKKKIKGGLEWDYILACVQADMIACMVMYPSISPLSFLWKVSNLMNTKCHWWSHISTSFPP